MNVHAAPSGDEESSSNITTIVGAAIGGLVLCIVLVIIIIVTFILLFRWRKKGLYAMLKKIWFASMDISNTEKRTHSSNLTSSSSPLYSQVKKEKSEPMTLLFMLMLVYIMWVYNSHIVFWMEVLLPFLLTREVCWMTWIPHMLPYRYIHVYTLL